MNDFQCVTLEKHSLLGHKLYQKTKTNEKADIFTDYLCKIINAMCKSSMLPI